MYWTPNSILEYYLKEQNVEFVQIQIHATTVKTWIISLSKFLIPYLFWSKTI